MKILVCIKQVPESGAVYDIDKGGQWITVCNNPHYKMNRFDEHALEEALLIKDAYEDVCVDVVTYGPERAAETLKRALGLGADRGLHIIKSEEGYTDPSEIAWNIASHAQGERYDLILAGVMSEDMMHGQTGQMIAEYLKMPCASAVVSLKVDPAAGVVDVEREIEGGMREALGVSLPALITIQAGINTPRYPILSKILKAREKELVRVEELCKEQTQILAGVTWPVKSRAGKVLGGTAEDKARELIGILRGKNALRS